MLKQLNIEQRTSLYHALTTAIEYYNEKIMECSKYDLMEDCTEWLNEQIVKWELLRDMI